MKKHKYVAYVNKEKLFEFEAGDIKLALKKAKRINPEVTHINVMSTKPTE